MWLQAMTATLDIWAYRLHNSTNYSLVPRHAWTPWFTFYVCNTASTLPSSMLADAHWTLSLQHLSTSQALWPWPWIIARSRYCWRSLGESCSWPHRPMACVNTTWYCRILCSHLHWYNHQPGWSLSRKDQWPYRYSLWSHLALSVSKTYASHLW